MVWRTWSVRSKTSIGSSAAPTACWSVGTGAPNSMSHLLGSGTSPSGPSHGNVGVIGAQGSGDEAAAAEALQLVPVAERLADPLEALGPHPDDLALGQEPLRVRVAG